MKKIISLFMIVCLISTLLPTIIAPTVVSAETITTEVYSETFDDISAFTLEDEGTQKVLKKNGKPQWYFADSDDAFNEAFPVEVTDLLKAPTNDAINSKCANNDSTAAMQLSGYTIGTSTVMYLNLDKKYTEGKLNFSLKLRRPGYNSSSSQLGINLFEDECTSYETANPAVSTAPANKKVSSINFVNHNGTPKFGKNYYDEYGRFTSSIVMGSDYKDNFKGWPRLDIEVDFDEKKVNYKVYSKSDYSLHVSNTVYSLDFLNEGAEGVSAIALSAGYSESEQLSSTINSISVDDVVITHTVTKLAEADISLDGKPIVGETLTGTYKAYSHEFNHPESQSVCTWYRAESHDLTTSFEIIKQENISVGKASTYEVTDEDLDHYIAFAVTPYATENGENVAGNEAALFVEGGAIRPYYDAPFSVITYPKEGDYIYTRDSVKLSANTICDSSDVTKVEYYANGDLIAESTEAPFDTEATLDVGHYGIVARAYNADGKYTDSPAVNIIVTSMKSVKFYQQDGTSPLSNTVTAYDGIVAKVEVANTSGETMYPTLVVGAYDDNKLIGIAVSKQETVTGGAVKNLSVEMSINNYQRVNIDCLRAFVWNADTCENYCEPTQFNRKDIKVLTIGNSFANNAATYIRSIGAADGENIIVGKANISSSTLETHVRLYGEDKKSYPLSITGKVVPFNCTLTECLEAEEWDFITIQQVSFKSHLFDTYEPYLTKLNNIIKKHAPQAKVIFHQTWAYTEKCARLADPTNSYYTKYFNGMTQDDMFAGIEYASKQASETIGCRIFPSGLAFQNARKVKPDSSFDNVGGFLNNNGDGYHANERGKFLAGAVYYECMTGNSMLDNTYKVSDISDENMEILRKAAHEAVLEYNWIN